MYVDFSKVSSEFIFFLNNFFDLIILGNNSSFLAFLALDFLAARPTTSYRLRKKQDWRPWTLKV